MVCGRLGCITLSSLACIMELILYIAFGILGGFILILSLLGIIGALVKHSQRSLAPSVLSAPLRTPPAAELAEFELLYPERASAIRGKAWARIHHLMLTECSVTGPIRNELREEAIAQVNSADLRDAVRSLLSAPSDEQAHELEVKGTVFALAGLERVFRQRLSSISICDENYPAIQEFYDYCRNRLDSGDVENP